MGFLPLFITRPGSTYQFPRDTDQEAWNTAHGPGSVGSVFEISLNCVLIVARLRQNLGVARCRDCSFNAKKVSRQVSRFAQKCRDCGQSVADRLESFYSRAHIALNCDILSIIATPTRHFFSMRDTHATPKVSRCFA